jgi:predicted DNA-binding antitoxin AbrB/MazE fold protein
MICVRFKPSPIARFSAAERVGVPRTHQTQEDHGKPFKSACRAVSPRDQQSQRFLALMKLYSGVLIDYSGRVQTTIQAIYENGVLHPLEPLMLGERQKVTVTISDASDVASNHHLLVSPAEWSHAADDDIGLEEVRRALSTIRGSLSESVIEERRER